MNICIKFFLILLALPLLTGCQSHWNQPIPETDIVYQTGRIGDKELGFINADGSDPIILKLGGYIRKPVWSPDGSLLYGLANDTVGGATLGYPAYWDREGNFKECRNWERFWHIEGAGNEANLKEVFISRTWEILLVDIEKCEEVKVLVNYEQSSSVNGIIGISYSPVTQELLYSLRLYDSTSSESAEYRIMKLNIVTGIEQQIAEGVNPAWSPDGSQIATIMADGIYLMNADGSQSRLLIKHDFFNLRSRSPFGRVDPIPHWSADGKWIVYHNCDDDVCYVDESTIYIVSVEDGQEIKIIDGGGYPSWRP